MGTAWTIAVDAAEAIGSCTGCAGARVPAVADAIPQTTTFSAVIKHNGIDYVQCDQCGTRLDPTKLIDPASPAGSPAVLDRMD